MTAPDADTVRALATDLRERADVATAHDARVDAALPWPRIVALTRACEAEIDRHPPGRFHALTALVRAALTEAIK